MLMLTSILIQQALGIAMVPRKNGLVDRRARNQSLQKRTTSGLSFKDLAAGGALPVHVDGGRDYFCPQPKDHDVYNRTAAHEPTVTIKLSRGFGTIKAREYGQKGGKFAVVIHQVYSNGGEWEPIALKLAAKHWYVLQPIWTGNPKTDPVQCVGPTGWSRWRCYPHVYTSNLNDILKATGYDKFDALLGFSWGGWAAGMRAAKVPDSVNRVALVCPAFLSEPEARKLDKGISVPTALFMGTDDRWVPYANSDFIVPMMTNVEFVHSPGDHCIHPKWEEQIVSFVDLKSGVPAIYTPPGN